MTTKMTTDSLLDLEHKFWDAMQEKDPASAGRLTDDGCIIVGAQGVSALDKATMRQMVSEAEWDLRDYRFDEDNAQIRMISEDVAIVAYKVSERLLVDGKPLTLEANDATVWVRKNGNWEAVLHTESPSGDPFGRDKQS